MKTTFGTFTITDDVSMVHVETVIKLLQQSYWAANRSSENIRTSIEHSICISVFHDEEQVGFARVVTDHAVFSWIADVIVDERFRKQGIGKEIMTFISNHPDIPKYTQLLKTKDAHGLYEPFGFQRDECMVKKTRTE